jgi:hypothetical protein
LSKDSLPSLAPVEVESSENPVGGASPNSGLESLERKTGIKCSFLAAAHAPKCIKNKTLIVLNNIKW